MTGVTCIMAGTGQGSLETQTLTVGTSGAFLYGYSTGSSIGSLSPATSTIYSGSSWIELSHNEFDGTTTLSLSTTATNSGWAKMVINSVEYTRASATYDTGTGTSRWRWSGAGFGRTPSPTSVVFN